MKNPYSNAGQGVYTLTTDAELEAFMALEHRYRQFIVQALIGNRGWSSRSSSGRLYHVGTVPDRRGNIYAADLRFMVVGGPAGFTPVGLYARRARTPLATDLAASTDSWNMLGTNLSVYEEDGSSSTQTERLLLMDSRDYNRLGLGLDDLVEAYVQTVLAVTAIDRMAVSLTTQKRRLKRNLFRSLNRDDALLEEIIS